MKLSEIENVTELNTYETTLIEGGNAVGDAFIAIGRLINYFF